MEFENEKLVITDIEQEMKKSFMEYSMSVIVSRALPDVRDGLKPVHRRILYTLFEKNLTHDKPYHKAADTVGAVLGSYHPHGDQSVYDALVRLAQDFSLRYPLVDGHGNFGSIDGDPAAAYRYTEARMAKISSEMLSDIGKETVDYTRNYDDRLLEPVVLPARFPNLLVNGSTGIAVGMATNIPPHNLGEVIDAILMFIENPDATMDELMQHIKGPDFPTGGIIMGLSGIRAAYATGRGKITLRSRAEIEEENGSFRIAISEIPYMVNKSRLLISIADLVKEKKVEGISNLRDESDRNGLRIVIELKRGANAQVILNKLYNFTSLQETVGVIMLALVNGEPKVLTLKEMLDNYINFQVEIITRRTQYDLRKARERAHILEGFMIALDFIDEVIAILRSSKTIPEGKERLIDRFNLTDIQADAIVSMRLGQLTGMEREKIENELNALRVKIADFIDILSDNKRILAIISEEITEIKKKYNDERRTSIELVSGEVDIEDLINREESVVTYTNIGYIKRQAIDTFMSQKRGGKGVTGMKQRDEDFVESMFIASTHDNVLFVTNFGNMFKLRCYEIPEGSKQAKGINIVNLLSLSEGEKVAAMLKTPEQSDENFNIVMVTKNGIIKRTNLYEYRNVRKKGIRAISLAEGDEVAATFLTSGDSHVIVATRNGYAIRFDETTIRSLGRTARGVRAIKLRLGDYVVGAAKVYDENMSILTVTDKGMGRRVKSVDYRLQKRGGLGLLNYKVCEEKGYVCNIRSVHEEDDVILVNSDGIIIRIRVKDVREMGRYATGVRVMRIPEGSWVVGFNRTEHDEDAEVVEVEQASEEDIANALAEEQNEVLVEEADEEADELEESEVSEENQEE